MKLKLPRIYRDKESSLGLFFIDDIRMCFTLEDEPRELKVRGETRIPAGTYKVRMDIPSSKDAAYKTFMESHKQKHYGMLRIMDVPGFQGILIHKGNYEKDTDGCILVGLTAGVDNNNHNSIAQSGDAYLKIYPIIAAELNAGKEVTITIIDENQEV